MNDTSRQILLRVEGIFAVVVVYGKAGRQWYAGGVLVPQVACDECPHRHTTVTNAARCAKQMLGELR